MHYKKSVRMQQIDHYETLVNYSGDRFMKAWKEYETVGLGVDWRAEYDTLEDLRREMGDLRSWHRE